MLSDEIDLLEPEADRAAAVEEELRGIADKQKFNVDKLVDLVKENGEILEKMKDNLRHRIAQDVIRIVVNSDRDGDNSISRTEAKTLSLQIKLQLETYGVEFDVDKFIKVVGSSPTVSSVIAIVQKLLLPTEEGENGDEEEDDVYDMFHVQDDMASLSVASEDIIGQNNRMFEDGSIGSPGMGSPARGGTRKSLVPENPANRRRGSKRNPLAGSLLRTTSS